MGEGISQKVSFTAANVCVRSRHCSSGTDAVQCNGGCSALRERLQCTAFERGKILTPKSPLLFWIREKGWMTHLWVTIVSRKFLLSPNDRFQFLISRNRIRRSRYMKGECIMWRYCSSFCSFLRTFACVFRNHRELSICLDNLPSSSDVWLWVNLLFGSQV